MKACRMFGLFGLLVAVAGGGRGQDTKPQSTAPPTKSGDVLPSAFRAYLVIDDRFPPKVTPPTKPEDRDPRDRTNRMHCLVCENGLSPGVAVFVRTDTKTLAPTGGVGRLIEALNGLLPKYRGDKLAAFVMFLRLEGGTKAVKVKNADGTETDVELDLEYPDDEKRDIYATEIRNFANSVKAPNVPFGLAPVKSKAVTAWGIGDNDEVTVVLFNRLRVVNRWTFKADGPSEAQIAEITKAVSEMVTGAKK